MGNVQLNGFFYFQKSFHTLDHFILLEKLCKYGVRGTILDYSPSYLSNRYQYVVYNDWKSDSKKSNVECHKGQV